MTSYCHHATVSSMRRLFVSGFVKSRIPLVGRTTGGASYKLKQLFFHPHLHPVKSLTGGRQRRHLTGQALSLRVKESFLTFCRENTAPHPSPLPPQGGEGTIFIGWGDQELVMRVYEFVNNGFFFLTWFGYQTII